MELIREYSGYVNVFEDKMNHRPFVLMACNYVSNQSLNSYVDINHYGMDKDYWEAGDRCMDRCCGELLKLLQDKTLMDVQSSYCMVITGMITGDMVCTAGCPT